MCAIIAGASSPPTSRKQSTDNERSTIAMTTPDGTTIVARQIAGAMARRIVTYARKGHKANIDGHLGFIKIRLTS